MMLACILDGGLCGLLLAIVGGGAWVIKKLKQ